MKELWEDFFHTKRRTKSIIFLINAKVKNYDVFPEKKFLHQSGPIYSEALQSIFFTALHSM